MVLLADDTAQALTKSISSANRVRGENVTINATLRFNVALWQDHAVVISGLTGSGTLSTSNLTIAGPAAEWFRNRARWNQTAGRLTLFVWEHIPAVTDIQFRFILENSAQVRASGVGATLSVTGDMIEITEVSMDASDVLMATEHAQFAVKSIGQNTDAFNALNRVAVTLRPTAILPPGTHITVSGLLGSQTGGTSIQVMGEDAQAFEPTASWHQGTGVLILAVGQAAPGLRDDRDSVIYVWLRNSGSLFAGSSALVASLAMNIADAPMDGLTLRAQTDGQFSAANLAYSTNRSFLRNEVHLSLTPNANLPEGTRITLTKLPLDTESNTQCTSTTVSDAPCIFPFQWGGATLHKCVDTPSAWSSGLPWCPTHAGFVPALADQINTSGTHNVTYINAARGAMWDYCRCDSNTSKVLRGSDAHLFGGAASWDATKSTMVLTVAPGKLMVASQAVDVSFVIRNPGVQVESGLPDYLWARVAAKVVEPYIEATCSTLEIVPNRSLGWGLSRYVAEHINVDVEEVLVTNITEIHDGQGAGQQELLEVSYCYAQVDGYGNMYGFAPMVEASEGGIFSISRQRVEAQELVIRPHGCSLAGLNPSDAVKVESDPQWVESSLGVGSNAYGALTSISVTLQPNWELDYPTEITVTGFQGSGFRVPNIEDGENIAVFNEGGQYFGYKGTFNESAGSVVLRVSPGMIVPCSKPSVVSFKLRNFADRTSLHLPRNLTASGPMGFFSSPLTTTPVSAPAASLPGFHW